MSKMTINGPISHEALAFSQAILTDLQGKPWLKAVLREFLSHDPVEACDAAELLLQAMRMRVEETGD